MAANRTEYILKLIREALDAEPTFDVVKVFKDSFTDARAIVYPFVQSQTVVARYEDGYPSQGRANVILYINAKSETDPGGQGKAQHVHSSITQKVEDCITDLVLPVHDTHDSGWTTTVHDVWVTSVGGLVDQAQNQVKVEYSIEVAWHSTKD